MTFNLRVFGNLQLIILILIIVILVLTVSFAYLSAKTSANDQKSLANVEQIQKALKLYYDENGFYPASNNGVPKDIETYLSFWPTPSPSGRCSKNYNEYSYTLRPGADYWVMFCLGGDNGDLKSGIHRASSKGLE
ncbi:MAG: hypothetical protein KW804_01970 [Candidatus Doudnabacteria bacterium]|nr:hypothetical protein [Candidatus Doudnabacteria bacterium]